MTIRLSYSQFMYLAVALKHIPIGIRVSNVKVRFILFISNVTVECNSVSLDYARKFFDSRFGLGEFDKFIVSYRL